MKALKTFLKSAAVLAGLIGCLMIIIIITGGDDHDENTIPDHHGQNLKVLRVSKGYPTAVQLSSGDVVYSLSFKEDGAVDVIKPGDTVAVDKNGYLTLLPTP